MHTSAVVVVARTVVVAVVASTAVEIAVAAAHALVLLVVRIGRARLVVAEKSHSAAKFQCYLHQKEA